MKKCNMALIGINGFGETHLNVAKRLQAEGKVVLKAVCEANYAGNSKKLELLKEEGVNCYSDYKDMLDKEKELDFTVIATPIHLHREMAVTIMNKGLNVLMEKPPAVTIQDLDDIIAASEKTGKYCAVDFQQTTDYGFIELTRRVSEGRLGKIISIRGKGLWKRVDSYYERTPWAGKLVFNNRYVLDGTINNPLAHLLNNMFFLAKAAEDFRISAVTAELYHGHSIEAEDTSCIRIEGESGLELLYYATLCDKKESTPSILVEGMAGHAAWNYDGELEWVENGRLSSEKFGNGGSMDKMSRIYESLCRCISGEEEKLICSVADTRNFVLASNGAFESSAGVRAIPSKYILRYEDEDSVATEIAGIGNDIERAFSEKKLYAETGIEWAIKGKKVPMDGYKEFKMFI